MNYVLLLHKVEDYTSWKKINEATIIRVIMSEEWDEYAENWDSNAEVITYSDNAFKTLLDAVNINGLRILDFGCGTGLLTERMSPLAKEIVALDSSVKMISTLTNKKLTNVFTVSDELTKELIRNNTLFSEKFDLIVASSVCSFLPEYEKTLDLLKSLLVPEGTFVQWDWLATEENSDFGLSRETIANAYNKVGLQLQALDQAFVSSSSEGDMPVLMGIAKNI